MRLWLRFLLAIALLAAGAAAVGGYVNRERLTRQWMAYRVGRAAGDEEARQALAWFETGPDRDERLRELVARWGDGNQQFDFQLARYVSSPESSESLRKSFSLALAWREGLLPRWTHWWCWRAGRDPSRQADEILAYVDLLDKAQDHREISWREVLDLQAIFCASGQPKWAERLQPSNWRDRFRQWRTSRPAERIRIEKPAQPLPGWKGPIPP